MKVYDRWWPSRIGRIIRRTRSTVMVRWDDGKTTVYDKAHQQFLEKADQPGGKQ